MKQQLEPEKPAVMSRLFITHWVRAPERKGLGGPWTGRLTLHWNLEKANFGHFLLILRGLQGQVCSGDLQAAVYANVIKFDISVAFSAYCLKKISCN